MTVCVKSVENKLNSVDCGSFLEAWTANRPDFNQATSDNKSSSPKLGYCGMMNAYDPSFRMPVRRKYISSPSVPLPIPFSLSCVMFLVKILPNISGTSVTCLPVRRPSLSP